MLCVRGEAEPSLACGGSCAGVRRAPTVSSGQGRVRPPAVVLMAASFGAVAAVASWHLLP